MEDMVHGAMVEPWDVVLAEILRLLGHAFGRYFLWKSLELFGRVLLYKIRVWPQPTLSAPGSSCSHPFPPFAISLCS